ncbi:MAG: EAL domain-containing protein [Lysinibacillus sp.]
MSIHNTLPLSREKLFVSLCSMAKQYSTGIAILDVHHTERPIVYYNESFAKLTGYNETELIGKDLSHFAGLKTAASLLEELDYHLGHALPYETSLIHYQKDGSPFWHELVAHPIRNQEGVVQYIMVHSKDVTYEKLFKMLSKLEHEVYLEIEKGHSLSHILQLITTQIETYYTRNIYCSIHLIKDNASMTAAASGTLPLEVADVLYCLELSTMANGEGNAVFVKDFTKRELAAAKKMVRTPLKMDIRHCWSKPICGSAHEVIGSITMYFQEKPRIKPIEIEFINRLVPLISLSIKYVAQTQQLRQLAYFDTETNLPNLHYFHTEMETWMEQGEEGIMIIIQPGEYSSIVDVYGRSTGDEVLRQMVERLQRHALAEGKEFIAKFSNSAIILASNTSMDCVESYELRIRQLTKEPFLILDKEIYITLKIGVTHFSPDGPLDEAIRQADMALSKSRQISGTNVAFFEEQNDARLQLEMDVLNQLTYGLQHKEFFVVLQPKININTLEIEGFEALCRWNSHVLGSVSPATFIPLAEQTGKIKQIDLLVMKQVLRWQRGRLESNEKTVPIAINISPAHFYDERFVKQVVSLIKRYKVPAHLIKLEVTESMELVDFSKAKEILSALRQHGIDCSIDDFGVGFSSLSYLQQLPFREIKIDRSFINAMDTPGMHAVVHTIVQLASNLQMNAVAEGIETSEQFESLKSMGCHTGQGYYFHKPLDMEDAARLIN